jgi:hypothetical protein
MISKEAMSALDALRQVKTPCILRMSMRLKSQTNCAFGRRVKKRRRVTL